MPNTRKIELSLEEIDTLQYTVQRFIEDRDKQRVGWDNRVLQALNTKLLAAGDDIYKAHQNAGGRS